MLQNLDEKNSILLNTFYRTRIRVFSLLFMSYVGFYFCRVNLLAALPILQDDFGFTNAQTGLILSGYFAVYSLGKITNGLLGDWIGGKIMLLLGIFGSVACNLFFGFGESLKFFIIVWSANAFFQSMGWLSMVSIMSHWYTSVESGRAMGIISLSYLLGDFAARSSAGFIIRLQWTSWIHLFWIHAALLSVIGIIAWAFIRTSPEKINLPDIETYAIFINSGKTDFQKKILPEVPSAKVRESKRWLVNMLASKWFWIVCLIYLGLSIVRYIFWSWSILYLRKSGLGISSAVIASAAFPILGSLGAIFAGWISDRMKARRGPVLALMTSCMVLSIFLFSIIPSQKPLFLIIALALVGFTLIGPYSLVAGAMAIDFGSRYAAAAAAGIIDAVGAVGAIFSGAGMGYLIDRFEWHGAFMIVIGIALVTALLCFSLWNFKPFTKSDEKDLRRA